MKPKASPIQHRLPFSFCLFIVVLVFFIPTIGFISYMDFIELKGELTASYNLMEINTESAIIQSLTLVDTGLKIFDSTLDDRMRNAFVLFLDEYERAGQNPEAMDLAGLKNRLGGAMDLYIIDAGGVIRYTTYAPDQGLDFSTLPDFNARLTALREGDTYGSDRVVKELRTGEVRKFAYMPTPDHAYLLELGLVSEEFMQYRSKLKFLQTTEELCTLNPALKSARIYDLYGETIGSGFMVPDEEKRRILDTIFSERQDYETTDPLNGTLTKYIFMDLSDPRFPSDPSLIVELVYDTKHIDTTIGSLFTTHVAIAVIAGLLCLLITGVGTLWITRPIRQIVEDADRVARGDLDHAIRVTGAREFVQLEKSINAMIATLKETIEKLRRSEEKIIHYTEGLEELVATRTTELHDSNATTNLYLDIMSHDINNAHTVSLGYAEMLRDLADPSLRTYTNKMITSIHHGINIIENVSTMRTLEEHETVLKPVDLDAVIRREIDSFPDTTVQYSGNPVWVMADELLSVVISNIIDNGRKFSGQNGRVCITVEEADDETVQVSVEDTGKGIPDAIKKEIFNRFSIGALPGSGKGLGLYIAATLIGRYGGTISADDRIFGDPGAGAVIRFTLKKANR
jgi:two-component system sensor histidine kinase BarA